VTARRVGDGHGASRVLCATSAVVLIVVAGAPPAYADNCGSLSDCSPSQLSAILVVGGLLGLGLVLSAGGLPRSGPAPNPDSTPAPEPAPPPAPPPPPYNPAPPDPEAAKKAAAQQKIADELAKGHGPKDWLKYVDTSGDGVNCADVAEAVDRDLGGQPTAAGDRTGKHGWQSQWEHPGHQYNSESIDDIAKQVKDGGPGTRGIVNVTDDKGQSHAFNVYNDNGKVVWLDGQKPPIISSNAKGFMNQIGYSGPVRSNFMQTNP